MIEKRPAQPLPPPSEVPQVSGSSGISFGALKDAALALVAGRHRDEQAPAPQQAGDGS